MNATTIADTTTEVDPTLDHYEVELLNTKLLDKNVEQLIRMTQVVSKFASTLCLRKIQVHAETDVARTPAPAWSDADNIWFGASKLGKLVDPKVVTAVKGLSLHEISHILMTPRVGSNIGVWVKQNDLWRAFNALEDMRIETFMTAKYPSTKHWLIATMAQHMLEKPDEYSLKFPLVHGRKYLPRDVRDAVQLVYEDQASVVELCSIIDEYIALNLSDNKSYTRATEIIQRYHELVMRLSKDDEEKPWQSKTGWQRISDPNGHDHRKEGELKSSSTSKPMSKAEQADIIDKVLKQMGSEAPYEQPGNSNDSGSGVGSHDGDMTDPKELVADVMQTALDKAMSTLEDDINSTIRQFNGDAELKGGTVKQPERAGNYTQSVDYKTVAGSKTFGTELELLRAEHDPSWDRRQESGRLNVQRYALGCEVDEAFDRWDMGREDAVDIECVVLLDTSPSMRWCIDKSYENMWAIKRALDKINASTTVLTFDDRNRILYDASERADIVYRYAGMGMSTEPRDSLKYAKYLLANSSRAIKLLIVITDGEWGDAEVCDNTIRELRNGGVITSLAFVDDSEWWNDYYKDMIADNPNYQRRRTSINTHGCEVAVKVHEASELFRLAKKVVKVGINRNLQ